MVFFCNFFLLFDKFRIFSTKLWCIRGINFGKRRFLLMESYEINKDTVALIPKDDNHTIVY